ncbi:MAG: pyridoxamine 5'-phosphate oxidase family protein, partial [Anaerolineales bacterium]|nr:pyridoxamine 5'-phosphate oxidase family protein [Anaerolineales bacterium]
MPDNQPAHKQHWVSASELPPAAYQAWHKPGRAISPVAIVATVDADGRPRTAPFGSLRAVSPRLLRLCCMRNHKTYGNLRRGGQVAVCLLSPPDIAVTVSG